MRRFQARPAADAGFSMVELTVYVVILGLLSTLIATVMVSLFRSEQTVSAISTATNEGQTFTMVFDRDARNARSVVPSAIGQDYDTMTLHTASSSAGAPCYRAVTYRLTDGTITRTDAVGEVNFDLKISSGGFTVESVGGQRFVGYRFSGGGAAPQDLSARAALGPADLAGAVCAS